MPLDQLAKSSELESPEENLLSVVIAVKDEQEEVKNTLHKLLNSGYPNLQVIIVNDRSTDDTKKIIDEACLQHENLKAVHIDHLPSGWLGKVNAMNQGYTLATGKYVLFMDGDVEINAEILNRSVNLANEKNLDHLTIMPTIPCPTFGLDLLVLTSQILFTVSARPWLSIEERPLKCVKGIGPYNLVRKSYFDQTEGFHWLKMDISDDVALSHLIAKDGGRSLYVRSTGSGPTFPWYRDGWHMTLGLEKNIVGGFTNYKISMLFLVSLMATSPVIFTLAAFLLGTKLSISLGVISVAASMFFAYKIKKFLHHPLLNIALFPLGMSLLTAVMLRAAFICYKNRGIYWSGTFYPLNELKQGIRVRLGL